ncbi:MAG: NHL repeat-containing protein [Candidatus Eisenbacteria bacterium]
MRARASITALAAWLALAALPAPPASSSDEPTTLVYPPFGHCLGIHRVTDFHRFVYLGMRTKLSNPTGIAAVKLRSEDDPSTDSDDDELTVFGLNSDRCEIIFNTSIYDASLYGSCGSGRDQFREPLGIAADEHGNVFVADTGNDRVVRLLYENGALRWVKQLGSSGSGERQLDGPSAIAVGASGTLYVCDSGNDRIVVMSSVGEPLGTIGGPAGGAARFEDLMGIAVVEADDPWIARDRDFMVVSDRGGARLMRLTRTGVVEGTLLASELPVADARFGALAIDFYGNVYALDREGGRIHKLDRNLRYVTSFGEPGTGDGQFDDPRDVTLWRRFGQIFITERSGASYMWIGTDILDLTVEPPVLSAEGESVTMSYLLTETSRVTIELLDSRGRAVASLVESRRRPVGDNRERWDDLASRLENPLEPGEYAFRVTATPTYSSGKYFHDTAEHPVTLR